MPLAFGRRVRSNGLHCTSSAAFGLPVSWPRGETQTLPVPLLRGAAVAFPSRSEAVGGSP